jgi:O-antigen ligase
MSKMPRIPASAVWRATLLVVALGPAVATLLSDRQLDTTSESPQIASAGLTPAAQWAGRATNALLLMLLVIGWHVWRSMRGTRASPLRRGLLIAFVAYSLTTLAADVWNQSYDTTVSTIAASAAIITILLTTPADARLWFGTMRLVLGLYVYLSLGFALIVPQRMVESGYQAGIIPGLNTRLVGLSSHAANLSHLAALFLLLEYFSARFVTGWNWRSGANFVAGAAVVVWSQSKGTWAILALCCAGLFVYQMWRRGGGARLAAQLICLLFGMALIALAPELVKLWDRLDSSFSRASLSTLTGRTEVWQFAISRWQESPLFGKGGLLWGPEDRMIFFRFNHWTPVHSHNQFIHTLAQSGIIGLAALFTYFGILARLSFRQGHTCHGLTIVLFALIGIRALAEVPFRLVVHDNNLILHIALISAVAMTLVSFERPRPTRLAPPDRASSCGPAPVVGAPTWRGNPKA